MRHAPPLESRSAARRRSATPITWPGSAAACAQRLAEDLARVGRDRGRAVSSGGSSPASVGCRGQRARPRASRRSRAARPRRRRRRRAGCPSSRCSEPIRGGAERGRLLAGQLDGGARLGGDAQPVPVRRRRAGARSRRRARGSGGARPGGRCRARGRPSRRSCRRPAPPGLDALEGVQLAAQRGQRVQRDLGVRGADGVLEQLGEAVWEVYRALQPRSMVTGTPVKAAPLGSGQEGDHVRDLLGLDQALDRVRREDDLLQRPPPR